MIIVMKSGATKHERDEARTKTSIRYFRGSLTGMSFSSMSRYMSSLKTLMQFPVTGQIPSYIWQK